MNPVVVFFGMPAAGKSTVIGHLTGQLVARWAPVHWSIDDVLEVQCPEGVGEFFGTRFYVRKGAHFLMHDEWRPGQMRRATAGLLILARATARMEGFARPPVLILELPLTELATFRAVATRQPDLTGLIVVLHSSGHVRRERNARRADHRRLPEQVLDYFEQALPAIDVPNECARLDRAGWTVLTRETAGPAEAMAAQLVGVVEAAAARSAPADPSHAPTGDGPIRD